MKIKYHFVVVGWNCEKYVDECVKSILTQNKLESFDYDIHITDDFSTDNTWNALQKYEKNPKVFLNRTDVNMGAAYSRYQLITNENFTDSDVILLVDMDDFLKPHALEYIDQVYQNHTNVEITYGSWITEAGKPVTLKKYSDEIIKSRRYEDAGAVQTHLRTFKVALLKNIEPYFFQLENEWVKNATDVALMNFLSRQTSNDDSIMPIEEILYVYRMNVPNSTVRRFARNSKILISRALRLKIKDRFDNDQL